MPRERLADELYDDLKRMNERYDYQRHASGDAEHAALITDRILDAISISGTPDEAVPRFRELAALGIDGFNVPVRGEAREALRLLADEVIPNV